MRIEVTRECIDKGGRGRSSHCPIALPIITALGCDLMVEVGYSVVQIGRRGQHDWRSYALPQVARDFIKAFDNHFPVKPISFDLPIEDLLCPSATP